MAVLAWFLLIFGALITLPAMITFPPFAVVGFGMMFGGYLLRRKARHLRMRRQQGRNWLD